MLRASPWSVLGPVWDTEGGVGLRAVSGAQRGWEPALAACEDPSRAAAQADRPSGRRAGRSGRWSVSPISALTDSGAARRHIGSLRCSSLLCTTTGVLQPSPLPPGFLWDALGQNLSAGNTRSGRVRATRGLCASLAHAPSPATQHRPGGGLPTIPAGWRNRVTVKAGGLRVAWVEMWVAARISLPCPSHR